MRSWWNQEYLTWEERGRADSPSQTFQGMASGRTILVLGIVQRVEAGLCRWKGHHSVLRNRMMAAYNHKETRTGLRSSETSPAGNRMDKWGNSHTIDYNPTVRNYCYTHNVGESPGHLSERSQAKKSNFNMIMLIHIP